MNTPCCFFFKCIYIYIYTCKNILLLRNSRCLQKMLEIAQLRKCPTNWRNFPKNYPPNALLNAGTFFRFGRFFSCRHHLQFDGLQFPRCFKRPGQDFRIKLGINGLATGRLANSGKYLDDKSRDHETSQAGKWRPWIEMYVYFLLKRWWFSNQLLVI